MYSLQDYTPQNVCLDLQICIAMQTIWKGLKMSVKKKDVTLIYYIWYNCLVYNCIGMLETDTIAVQ